MTILVQKEVAERIVAKDGKESLLSLSVKLYGTPLYKGTVSKRYFSPAPKVDSAILYIKDIKQEVYSAKDREKFFELLHFAFAHKRKTILHNLGGHYSKELLKEQLRSLGKSEQARAEELGIKDWHSLFTNIK
jgi:16S rRNA (adenine1518-N6/adenine1519-N6)-dimethyltransferase